MEATGQTDGIHFTSLGKQITKLCLIKFKYEIKKSKYQPEHCWPWDNGKAYVSALTCVRTVEHGNRVLFLQW